VQLSCSLRATIPFDRLINLTNQSQNKLEKDKTLQILAQNNSLSNLYKVNQKVDVYHDGQGRFSLFN
jgi:hypothetical protein